MIQSKNRTAPHVAVIEASEALADESLRERFSELSRNGIKLLVIDMRPCTKATVSGLLSLVHAHEGFEQGTRLFGLAPNIATKIRRYGVDRKIPIFLTEDDALEGTPRG